MKEKETRERLFFFYVFLMYTTIYNLPRTIKQKRTGPEQRAEQAQLEMVAQSSTSRKRACH
jgi:hypothetical protein